MREFVQELETRCGGLICFAFTDFQTGTTQRYRADHLCQTASIIKLPILVHAALAVREGQKRWDEKLRLTDGEKVGGSGVLTQLTSGLEISLRDLCVLMTVVSDNTATNMVIAHLGVEPVNARMRSLGLPLTTLYRKSYSSDSDSFDVEASRVYGLGRTTAQEMLDLLTLLAEGKIGDAETSREILTMMEAQMYRDAIPRYLPEDWKYAGKTGAINAVRNDVALVTAPDGRRFALSLFCQQMPVSLWTPDNPGLLALAELTRWLLLERT